MTTTLPAERLEAILVRHDIINATLAGGPEADSDHYAARHGDGARG